MGQSTSKPKSKSKSKATSSDVDSTIGLGSPIFTIKGTKTTLVICEPLVIPNIELCPYVKLLSAPITISVHSTDYKIQFFTKPDFFQQFSDYGSMNPVYENLAGTGITIFDQGPIESLTLRCLVPDSRITLDPSRFQSLKIESDPDTTVSQMRPIIPFPPMPELQQIELPLPMTRETDAVPVMLSR